MGQEEREKVEKGEKGEKHEGSCVTQQCGVVSALYTLDMCEEHSKGNCYWFG